MLMIYQNWLLAVTKVQILKVIHNTSTITSKSVTVVSNHKDTNFENNSQLRIGKVSIPSGCWKSKRYKF